MPPSTSVPAPSAGAIVPGPPAGVSVTAAEHARHIRMMTCGKTVSGGLTASSMAARNVLLAAYTPWVRDTVTAATPATTNDSDWVEEAVAESLLRCVERLTDYDPRGGVPLSDWMMSSRSVSATIPQSAQLLGHASLDDNDLPQLFPVDESLPIPWGLLFKGLTPAQFEVTRLHIGVGTHVLTIAEIAAVLNVTEDAVAHLWHRAVRALRRELVAGGSLVVQPFPLASPSS